MGIFGQYTGGDETKHRALTMMGTFTPPSRSTGSAGDTDKAVAVTAPGSASAYPTAAVITAGQVLGGRIKYVDPNGDAATVQVDGIMRLLYTGDAPTIGIVMSVEGGATAGKVAFAAAAAGKRQCLILDVDATNTEAEFILL